MIIFNQFKPCVCMGSHESAPTVWLRNKKRNEFSPLSSLFKLFILFFLFNLILYSPVKNFSVMSGQVFMG